MNKQEKTNSTPIQPGAYYVNYPGYNVGLGGGVSAPLGHAGVFIVHNDGSRKYYEYGRYGSGIGSVKPVYDGN